jgi:DNA-binding MarR family transcriptional regulator
MAADYPSAAIERLWSMAEHYRLSVLKRIDRYSSGESLVLRVLAHHDGPAHPSELREHSCTSSARVAAVLKTLEKKGFIERAADESDHRKVLVSITQEGRRRVADELDAMGAEAREAFRELGEADTAEFLRILERLLEAFVQAKAPRH